MAITKAARNKIFSLVQASKKLLIQEVESQLEQYYGIHSDGSITDVKVLRGIGGGCDEEAIRVVKGMPKWNPGKQRGKSVRVQYNLPINFILK